MITIDVILAHTKKNRRYVIDNRVNKYLYYVDEEPFYIGTNFTEIRFKDNLPAMGANVVLFSAPGATGKSALASYISWKTNGLYWDLSKMKIGNNSFSGTILEGVSHENYSQYVMDLKAGKANLIIDALDEAEIISGSQMLMTFIDEASSVLGQGFMNAPVIFLLARTETAQDVVRHCAEKKIPLKHYQIDFFDKLGAIKFIEKKINKTGDVVLSECINNYYTLIEEILQKKDTDSFLGYAPVLEAISQHIKEFRNAKKLLNGLKINPDCASIVKKILDDILLREQKEKLIPAFRQKESISNEFDTRDLFSRDEQLARVLNYVLMNEKQMEEAILPDLPYDYIESYSDTWNIALDQHPFIRKKASRSGDAVTCFAGPAFRDYTLASLLQDESDKRIYAEWFLEEQSDDRFTLSQIFFDCYLEMSDKEIFPKDMKYLYEAFRSKASAYQIPKLSMAEYQIDSSDVDNECRVGFSFENDGESGKKPYIGYVKKTNEPIFLGGVSQCDIDIPNHLIVMGEGEETVTISNSSIIAKQICLKSSNVIIEAFSPNNVVIVSSEPLEYLANKFEILGDGDFKIDVPNINKYFKLIRHSFDFSKPVKNNILGFVHVVHTIIREFRTHGKDTLGKDAEKINNVVIGKSKDKEAVLNYLLRRNIVYKDKHLYKIDLNAMKSLGINNVVLYRIDENVEHMYFEFKRLDEE